VRQSLGAALLMAGRADEAAEVLRRSLLDAPNNVWALYALMEAQKMQGDDAAAAVTAELFAKAWAGDTPPDLARL
jgi:Flp pilus assembly protein TadD